MRGCLASSNLPPFEIRRGSRRPASAKRLGDVDGVLDAVEPPSMTVVARGSGSRPTKLCPCRPALAHRRRATSRGKPHAVLARAHRSRRSRAVAWPRGTTPWCRRGRSAARLRRSRPVEALARQAVGKETRAAQLRQLGGYGEDGCPKPARDSRTSSVFQLLARPTPHRALASGLARTRRRAHGIGVCGTSTSHRPQMPGQRFRDADRSTLKKRSKNLAFGSGRRRIREKVDELDEEPWSLRRRLRVPPARSRPASSDHLCSGSLPMRKSGPLTECRECQWPRRR